MFDPLPDVPNSIEILKNKLYWISTSTPLTNPKYAYFSLDNELKYNPLNYDFGPIHLGKVYKLTRDLLNMLNDLKFSNTPLIYRTSLDSAKRANSAFLMCAFQIIVFGRSADTVWAPFSKLEPELAAFRDASYTRECTYKCTILDCLRGLEYAIKLKWFDLGTFDQSEYDFYSEVENGDLNWIIPRKMWAFAGPFNRAIDIGGYQRMTPENYSPIFKKLDVGTIIRLNDKVYDEQYFKKQGFNHIDMIFPDGSCPSKEIITQFLEVCEQELGGIAIHCKAGLGRTGTLIACYAIKHFKFPAADFIGWIRLCRPGSILGPQQQFLIDIEPYLHSLSEKSQIYNSISPVAKHYHSLRLKEERRSYSLSQEEQMVAIHGESGQGGFLLEAKDRARKSCRVQSNNNVSIFSNKNKSFIVPSTPINSIFEEEIPVETIRTVNRILLSRHDSASRGTLTRQAQSKVFA